MNPEAEEYLKKLVEKTPEELTDGEIAFLRARRDYLTGKQEGKFAKVLKGKVKGVDANEVVDEPKEIKYKDLQKKAKELGLPYVGVSKEDLKRDIATVLGPGSEVE